MSVNILKVEEWAFVQNHDFLGENHKNDKRNCEFLESIYWDCKDIYLLLQNVGL